MGNRSPKYSVSCSECDFEATMGSVDEILDRQVAHRREHGDEHVLEFEADE